MLLLLFSSAGEAVEDTPATQVDRGAGSGGINYEELIAQMRTEDDLVLGLIHQFMERRNAA